MPRAKKTQTDAGARATVRRIPPPSPANALDVHDENVAKRIPVDFDFAALHPEFMFRLAKIAGYANEKYGAWSQYTKTRLVGDKSPISHALNHIRLFQARAPYDRFDCGPRWHLAAAAYNLMMEFFYTGKFGFENHPLMESEDGPEPS